MGPVYSNVRIPNDRIDRKSIRRKRSQSETGIGHATQLDPTDKPQLK